MTDDIRRFYDELAPDYDAIYHDWDATVQRTRYRALRRADLERAARGAGYRELILRRSREARGPAAPR